MSIDVMELMYILVDIDTFCYIGVVIQGVEYACVPLCRRELVLGKETLFIKYFIVLHVHTVYVGEWDIRVLRN